MDPDVYWNCGSRRRRFCRCLYPQRLWSLMLLELWCRSDVGRSGNISHGNSGEKWARCKWRTSAIVPDCCSSVARHLRGDSNPGINFNENRKPTSCGRRSRLATGGVWCGCGQMPAGESARVGRRHDLFPLGRAIARACKRHRSSYRMVSSTDCPRAAVSRCHVAARLICHFLIVTEPGNLLSWTCCAANGSIW